MLADRADFTVKRFFLYLAQFQLFGPNDNPKIGRERRKKRFRRDLLRQVGTALVALSSIAPLAVAGQNNSRNSSINSAIHSAAGSGSWSGILVSSSCNADEAFNESPECFKDVPGAKLALYDDTNRVMYGLEPQKSVSAHLGDMVTVRGTLDEDTIQLSSIELMSIGLAVGQKAPAFSVHDQFGRVQTLDTLRGANGTVLLFFRSADW